MKLLLRCLCCHLHLILERAVAVLPSASDEPMFPIRTDIQKCVERIEILSERALGRCFLKRKKALSTWNSQPRLFPSKTGRRENFTPREAQATTSVLSSALRTMTTASPHSEYFCRVVMCLLWAAHAPDRFARIYAC